MPARNDPQDEVTNNLRPKKTARRSRFDLSTANAPDAELPFGAGRANEETVGDNIQVTPEGTFARPLSSPFANRFAGEENSQASSIVKEIKKEVAAANAQDEAEGIAKFREAQEQLTQAQMEAMEARQEANRQAREQVQQSLEEQTLVSSTLEKKSAASDLEKEAEQKKSVYEAVDTTATKETADELKPKTETDTPRKRQEIETENSTKRERESVTERGQSAAEPTEETKLTSEKAVPSPASEKEMTVRQTGEAETETARKQKLEEEQIAAVEARQEADRREMKRREEGQKETAREREEVQREAEQLNETTENKSAEPIFVAGESVKEAAAPKSAETQNNTVNYTETELPVPSPTRREVPPVPSPAREERAETTAEKPSLRVSETREGEEKPVKKETRTADLKEEINRDLQEFDQQQAQLEKERIAAVEARQEADRRETKRREEAQKEAAREREKERSTRSESENARAPVAKTKVDAAKQKVAQAETAVIDAAAELEAVADKKEAEAALATEMLAETKAAEAEELAVDAEMAASAANRETEAREPLGPVAATAGIAGGLAGAGPSERTQADANVEEVGGSGVAQEHFEQVRQKHGYDDLKADINAQEAQRLAEQESAGSTSEIADWHSEANTEPSEQLTTETTDGFATDQANFMKETAGVPASSPLARGGVPGNVVTPNVMTGDAAAAQAAAGTDMTGAGQIASPLEQIQAQLDSLTTGAPTQSAIPGPVSFGGNEPGAMSTPTAGSVSEWWPAGAAAGALPGQLTSQGVVPTMIAGAADSEATGEVAGAVEPAVSSVPLPGTYQQFAGDMGDYIPGPGETQQAEVAMTTSPMGVANGDIAVSGGQAPTTDTYIGQTSVPTPDAGWSFGNDAGGVGGGPGIGAGAGMWGTGAGLPGAGEMLGAMGLDGSDVNTADFGAGPGAGGEMAGWTDGRPMVGTGEIDAGPTIPMRGDLPLSNGRHVPERIGGQAARQLQNGLRQAGRPLANLGADALRTVAPGMRGGDKRLMDALKRVGKMVAMILMPVIVPIAVGGIVTTIIVGGLTLLVTDTTRQSGVQAPEADADKCLTVEKTADPENKKGGNMVDNPSEDGKNGAQPHLGVTYHITITPKKESTKVFFDGDCADNLNISCAEEGKDGCEHKSFNLSEKVCEKIKEKFSEEDGKLTYSGGAIEVVISYKDLGNGNVVTDDVKYTGASNYSIINDISFKAHCEREVEKKGKDGTTSKEKETTEPTSYHDSVRVCVGKCANGDYCWPTSGSVSQIPYQPKGYSHQYVDSVDIAGNKGFAVYAPFDGSYKYRWQEDISWIYEGGRYGKGYGCNAQSVHDGMRFIFGHMDKSVCDKILGSNSSKTVQLKKGQKMGIVDNTGHSTGPHLHLQVSNNRYLRSCAPGYPKGCWEGFADRDPSKLETLFNDGVRLKKSQQIQEGCSIFCEDDCNPLGL